MKKQVRVYLVEKNNGKQDTLNRNNHIPKTVNKVYITWDNGSEKAKLDREEFLNNYKWAESCYWIAK